MKQFIQAHKLLCVILACVIVAGAACAVVLPIALKHEHTFSTEWSSDENNHWHKATCEHTDETTGLAKHDFDGGLVAKDPTETEKGVRTYTCSVCDYKKTAEIDELEHTHTFDTTSWEHDGENHWHKATCSHTCEKGGLEKHTFGNWETVTAADYGVNRVDKRTCSVCEFEQNEEIENSALQPKENEITVGEINFTYSKRAQSINGLIEADNNVGMTVQYRVKGETEYTSEAPVNAGTYEYLITVPQTEEWQKGEKTGEFVIEKYKVTCPSSFVSTLNKGETTTKKLCEIDLSDDENIDLDEIKLIYSSENNPNGIGAQRMNVKVTSIKVDPEFESNFEIIGLPTGNNATIEWIVKDGTDEFAFRNNGAVDASLNYYQGTIFHGSVEVGDKLFVLGISGEKQVKVSCTITKIEYNKKYTSDYVETTVATKGENVKITFTKDDASVNLSDVKYIVSAQTIDEINQFRPTTQSDELSFIGNEYRVFKLKVNTANTIQITAKNEYASLTVYDAKTGAEIELTGNELQVAEGTEILIVVKQTTTNGTNKITVETVE